MGGPNVGVDQDRGGHGALQMSRRRRLVAKPIPTLQALGLDPRPGKGAELHRPTVELGPKAHQGLAEFSHMRI
jgi:hypothetical protein